MDHPKLRPVHAFPVQMSGQRVVCLQDPQNICEKALFLPAPLYFVVSHFDGHHSILDIQAEYLRSFGQFLYTEEIQGIIRQLEENLFLEGDHFQKALRQLEEDFRNATVREALHAGKSYEADPDRLRHQLEGYFQGLEGSGGCRPHETGGVLRGVIAPHIDFRRGGVCYARAHQEIRKEGRAHRFVVLGTAHVPMRNPFCLTRKPFMTPLGRLDADTELIDAIQSRCPYDLCLDEWVHRSEHSVEFQCVFLRHLMPEPVPLKIVPVLCGSFHPAVTGGVSPLEIEGIRPFLDALKLALKERGEDVCLVASADLAHRGQQFGDEGDLPEYKLRGLEEEDREMLGPVERLDGEGFFRTILRDQDRRRICGLPAIYTLLHVLSAQEGRLLDYGQAFTPETQSVVTFASLAFYG